MGGGPVPRGPGRSVVLAHRLDQAAARKEAQGETRATAVDEPAIAPKRRLLVLGDPRGAAGEELDRDRAEREGEAAVDHQAAGLVVLGEELLLDPLPGPSEDQRDVRRSEPTGAAVTW
jgi:hypothetical protein